MGNVSSLRRFSPCECLHQRKVAPSSNGTINDLPNGVVTNPYTFQPTSIYVPSSQEDSSKDLPITPSANVNESISTFSGFTKEDCPMCWLFLGLDDAGKSSVVHAIANSRLPPSRKPSSTSEEEPWDPKPTYGFSKEEVLVRKHRLLLHDVGGAKSIRGIWKNYFAESHGIVFVIDVSIPEDSPRWEEMRLCLEGLIGNGKVLGKPFLFLLNKADLDDKLDVKNLFLRLNMPDFAERISAPFQVFQICAHERNSIRDASIRKALCQKNLESAIYWLIERIEQGFPALHSRVQKDAKLQQEFEDQQRKERIARYKAAREAEDQQEQASENEDQQIEGFIPVEDYIEHLQGNEEPQPKSVTENEEDNEAPSRDSSIVVIMDTGIQNSELRHHDPVSSPKSSSAGNRNFLNPVFDLNIVVSDEENSASETRLKLSRRPLFKRHQ